MASPVGGLSIEDVALALDISSATVKREWSSARVWFYEAMSSSG
jgi:DNA-directed RNA polymerase specialized sigma24 family protein